MLENSKTVLHHAAGDLFTGISASGHAHVLDFGGAKHAASPVEYLLLALGGCTGADVVSILRKMRQRVTAYRVEVSGQRREEHPRAFTRIELKHILTGHNLDPNAVTRAIQLSDEKYCSVAATLRPAAEIVSSFEIVDAASSEEPTPPR